MVSDSPLVLTLALASAQGSQTKEIPLLTTTFPWPNLKKKKNLKNPTWSPRGGLVHPPNDGCPQPILGAHIVSYPELFSL